MAKQPSTVLIQPSHRDLAISADEDLEGSSRILLICHAEGMHNRYQELAGLNAADNSGLTALGWQQADKLAAWLMAHDTLDLLVSGAQLHSRLTAQRIGQALGLPVTVAKDMPGRISQQDAILEPLAVLPEGLDPEIHTSTHNAVAEPYIEFHHALISTLSELILQHTGKTIAVVTSGSAIATILRHFFGAHKLQVRVGHTSLSEITQRGSQWCLQYVNRSEHLPVRKIVHAAEKEQPSATLDENEDLALIAQVYNRAANNLASDDVAKRVNAYGGGIDHLLNFANIPAGSSVLDIGSGLGAVALVAAERGAAEVIGIDISLAMLEHAEYLRLSTAAAHAQRVNFRLAPAQLMPFRNERFDFVLCRFALSMAHVPERILREASRVLKSGGVLVLVDLLGDEDAVRLATQNAIEARRNPAHAAVRDIEQYRALVRGADLAIDAESVVIFERRLDEWLGELLPDPIEWAAVREMVEASIETDAAGLKARVDDNDQIVFDQKVVYVRTVKPQ